MKNTGAFKDISPCFNFNRIRRNISRSWCAAGSAGRRTGGQGLQKPMPISTLGPPNPSLRPATAQCSSTACTDQRPAPGMRYFLIRRPGPSAENFPRAQMKLQAVILCSKAENGSTSGGEAASLHAQVTLWLNRIHRSYQLQLSRPETSSKTGGCVPRRTAADFLNLVRSRKLRSRWDAPFSVGSAW